MKKITKKWKVKRKNCGVSLHNGFRFKKTKETVEFNDGGKASQHLYELDSEFDIYIIGKIDEPFFLSRHIKKPEITLIEWENVTENSYPFDVNPDEELGEDVDLNTLEQAKDYAIKYYKALRGGK